MEAVDFAGHYQVIHDDFVVSGSGGFLQMEVNHLFGPRYLVFYEREHRRRRGKLKAGESHLEVWSALPNPDGFWGEIAMFWASHERGFRGQR